MWPSLVPDPISPPPTPRSPAKGERQPASQSRAAEPDRSGERVLRKQAPRVLNAPRRTATSRASSDTTCLPLPSQFTSHPREQNSPCAANRSLDDCRANCLCFPVTPPAGNDGAETTVRHIRPRRRRPLPPGQSFGPARPHGLATAQSDAIATGLLRDHDERRLELLVRDEGLVLMCVST